MTEQAINSFQNLQISLTEAPVLVNPDFERPFHIQCDASNVGIGGVLFQEDENKQEHPIYIFFQLS